MIHSSVFFFANSISVCKHTVWVFFFLYYELANWHRLTFLLNSNRNFQGYISDLHTALIILDYVIFLLITLNKFVLSFFFLVSYGFMIIWILFIYLFIFLLLSSFISALLIELKWLLLEFYSIMWFRFGAKLSVITIQLHF